MADEITATVVRLVRETLALDDEQAISPQQLLFYDLAFTSMDLLDLLFRIEDHFGVAVERGTLGTLAQGGLPDEAFAADGFLTGDGRRQLMALLDDSPAEIFPERIHADTLARYCTVAAIARLVRHRLGKAEEDV